MFNLVKPFATPQAWYLREMALFQSPPYNFSKIRFMETFFKKYSSFRLFSSSGSFWKAYLTLSNCKKFWRGEQIDNCG